MKQDDIFLKQEGDAWFRRNQAALGNAGKIDWPLRVISLLGNKADLHSIIELGCSNGYRLHRLHHELPGAQRLVGVDVSAEAIEDGRRRYPGLELHQAPLSELPLDTVFDLTIINFVLHWVDRATLAASVAEIDRVTRDGGLLLIGDFLPDFPQRRRYHHYQAGGVYTFKQDYAAIFVSLGTYKELARVTFDHDNPQSEVQAAASGSRGMCCVLRKSLDGYYPEIP